MTLFHESDDFRDLNFRYSGCLAILNGEEVVRIVEIDAEGNIYCARPHRDRVFSVSRERLDPTPPEFGMIHRNQNFCLMTYRTVTSGYYQFGIKEDIIQLADPLKNILPGPVVRRIRRPRVPYRHEAFWILKNPEYPEPRDALNRVVNGRSLSQAISKDLFVVTNSDSFVILGYRGYAIGWVSRSGRAILPENLSHLRETVEEYYAVEDIIDSMDNQQNDNPFNEEEHEDDLEEVENGIGEGEAANEFREALRNRGRVGMRGAQFVQHEAPFDITFDPTP